MYSITSLYYTLLHFIKLSGVGLYVYHTTSLLVSDNSECHKKGIYQLILGHQL